MAAKRVLISIDERLLERVDREARQAGTTRSGYLAQLVDAQLAAAIGPGADPSVRAALSSIDTVLGDGTKR